MLPLPLLLPLLLPSLLPSFVSLLLSAPCPAPPTASTLASNATRPPFQAVVRSAVCAVSRSNTQLTRRTRAPNATAPTCASQLELHAAPPGVVGVTATNARTGSWPC